MSTMPPTMNRHERFHKATQRGPSTTKQFLILAMGTACATIMAFSGTRIVEPVWLIGLIPPLPLFFLGFIATASWRLNSSVSGRVRTVIGPLGYLGCASVVAGAILVAEDMSEAPKLVGRVLIAFTCLLAFLAVVAFVARRVSRNSIEKQRNRGMRSIGVVTDDGLAGFPKTPNPKLANITVRFIDNSGVERWLTPTAYQIPAQPINIDDEVTVWFDPENPGDISKSLSNGITASHAS
ncbi:hypothetical protein BDB13_4059 [Rhodococcus sp. OK302]|nr:hypothetical protein BDB13_4059 [Rhodococcus sp. OK302]